LHKLSISKLLHLLLQTTLPAIYAMPVAEMTACSPHERNGKPDPVFIVNSGMVLDDLADMFCDTLSWMYMKDFVQPRDGCSAYQALFNHYLGPNSSCHDQLQ
jgi:hypothetical protein